MLVLLVADGFVCVFHTKDKRVGGDEVGVEPHLEQLLLLFHESDTDIAVNQHRWQKVLTMCHSHWISWKLFDIRFQVIQNFCVVPDDDICLHSLPIPIWNIRDDNFTQMERLIELDCQRTRKPSVIIRNISSLAWDCNTFMIMCSIQSIKHHGLFGRRARVQIQKQATYHQSCTSLPCFAMHNTYVIWMRVHPFFAIFAKFIYYFKRRSIMIRKLITTNSPIKVSVIILPVWLAT